MVPSRAEITTAADLIAGRIRRTPVIDYAVDAMTVQLKLELLQHAGSFKPRGAFATVLAALARRERPQRLVAASGGNHGLAVAHVGQVLGIPTEIYVPATAPSIKVAAIRSRGAEVRLVGDGYAEALAASADRAAEPGSLSVHAYDAATTVTGQGTIALELDQQGGFDTVVVAVGGGGLIGGIAAWCAGAGIGVHGGGRQRVVGVEPVDCPTLHTALDAGEPVDVAVSGVAVDALGARRLGSIAFDAVRAAHGESVLVDDAAIVAARQRLWDDLRIAAEPAGAAALAALTTGGYRPEPDERVTVIVCGGNADPSDLGHQRRPARRSTAGS